MICLYDKRKNCIFRAKDEEDKWICDHCYDIVVMRKVVVTLTDLRNNYISKQSIREDMENCEVVIGHFEDRFLTRHRLGNTPVFCKDRIDEFKCPACQARITMLGAGK